MSTPKKSQNPARQGHGVVPAPPNKAWSKFLQSATGKEISYAVTSKSHTHGSSGGSNLIGLSDATGSMAGIWETTGQQIKELI